MRSCGLIGVVLVASTCPALYAGAEPPGSREDGLYRRPEVSSAEPITIDRGVKFSFEAAAIGAMPDALAEGQDSGWHFEVSPYIWIPAQVSGDSTIANTTISLDLNMSDVFSLFSGALSARFEAWNEPWGFFIDGMYVRLQQQGSTPGPDVQLDIQQAAVDFGAGYQIGEWDIGDGPSSWRVHALGGVRWAYIKQEIELNPGPNLGNSNDYMEVFVGGRFVFDLDERWSIVVRGDVGGFGFGTGSELTWHAMAGVGYKFSDLFSLRLGYLFYGIDYDQGSGLDRIALDAWMHGPYLMATFQW